MSFITITPNENPSGFGSGEGGVSVNISLEALRPTMNAKDLNVFVKNAVPVSVGLSPVSISGSVNNFGAATPTRINLSPVQINHNLTSLQPSFSINISLNPIGTNFSTKVYGKGTSVGEWQATGVFSVINPEVLFGPPSDFSLAMDTLSDETVSFELSNKKLK